MNLSVVERIVEQQLQVVDRLPSGFQFEALGDCLGYVVEVSGSCRAWPKGWDRSGGDPRNWDLQILVGVVKHRHIGPESSPKVFLQANFKGIHGFLVGGWEEAQNRKDADIEAASLITTAIFSVEQGVGVRCPFQACRSANCIPRGLLFACGKSRCRVKRRLANDPRQQHVAGRNDTGELS